jgi:hypothetical protein
MPFVKSEIVIKGEKQKIFSCLQKHHVDRPNVSVYAQIRVLNLYQNKPIEYLQPFRLLMFSS